MTAGMSRIRPILITSITTIAAMLPLAMGDTSMQGLSVHLLPYSDRRTFLFRHADADFNSDSLYGTGKCASVVPFVIP